MTDEHRIRDFDAEIAQWSKTELGADQSAVLRRSRGRLELRAGLGLQGDFPKKQLGSVERVVGTGRAEHRPRELCVPIYGSKMNVVGALYLGLGSEGRGFEDQEFQFAQRCVRWLERARQGRAAEKPRLQKKAPSAAKPQQTPANQVRMGGGAAKFNRPEVFFRSLHTMVTAGLALHESLHFLSESTEDSGGKAVASGLAQEVSGGNRLSVSMEKFPRAFDSYQIGLVEVAENSGALSQVLRVIAEHLERSQALNQKLKGALLYPALLVAGALTLMIVAPAWLLEGHFKMLEGSGQELPWLTQLVMGWSEFCRSPLCLALLVAMAFLAVSAFSQTTVKRALRNLADRLPALSTILQLSATARFARSLSLAMKAGVNVVQALPLSIRSTDDSILKTRGEEVMDDLKSGSNLSEALGSINFFPKSFVHVLVAGEESGKTVSILEMMASLYELEITSAVDQLTQLLEPLLLLLIGIFTGVVLVATMQPTISLLQTL